MTIKEAKEWLTEERLARINHHRDCAGENELSKEKAVRLIAYLSRPQTLLLKQRYE